MNNQQMNIQITLDAAANGDLRTLNLNDQFLDLDLGPYVPASSEPLTPMGVAAANGQLAALLWLNDKFLVEDKLPEHADYSGRAPLFYAFDKQQSAAIYLLLALGHDFHAVHDWQFPTSTTHAYQSAIQHYANLRRDISEAHAGLKPMPQASNFVHTLQSVAFPNPIKQAQLLELNSYTHENPHLLLIFKMIQSASYFQNALKSLQAGNGIEARILHLCPATKSLETAYQNFTQFRAL